MRIFFTAQVNVVHSVDIMPCICQFVYPVPRDEGYEFMFGQFSGHRCHFTSLINYQQHQENAPVSLTLTHYTDLQKSKGGVSLIHRSFEAKVGCVLQWNIRTPWKEGDLINRTDLTAPNTVYYNLCNQGTSLIRTLSSVPRVSRLQGFHHIW